jgi:ATP-dependent DNA helicase PIF1
MVLTDDQKAIMDAAADGQSLFYTGAAGTGKSEVMHYIYSAAVKRFGKYAVFITASTGIAAVNVGGCTVHSFAGIGLGKEPIDKLIKTVIDNRMAKRRWLRCKMLIIDEISMISSELFDKLDSVARHVRKQPDTPFGGIQVVLCGDFLQLPPVPDRGETTHMCFQSSAWSKLVGDRMFILTRIFRQVDRAFTDALSDIRMGKMSDATLTLLSKCRRPLPVLDGIEPTTLYPLNADVESINSGRLAKLPSVEYMFQSDDWEAKLNSGHLGQLQRNCPAVAQLTLKRDAQVILVYNLDVPAGLANGTRGVVTGFKTCETAHEYPVVRFTNGKSRVCTPQDWKLVVGDDMVATRRQVPLRLAWALTIHKSQGMTIDRLNVSLGTVFEVGQAYVALSRARSLDGLCILDDVRPDKVKASADAVKFYTDIQSTCGISSSSSSSSKTN